MLDKLKGLWSQWKVHVSVVGGILILSSIYGTCSFEPPTVSEAAVVPTALTITPTTTTSVEVSAEVGNETTDEGGTTSGTTEETTTTATTTEQLKAAGRPVQSLPHF